MAFQKIFPRHLKTLIQGPKPLFRLIHREGVGRGSMARPKKRLFIREEGKKWMARTKDVPKKEYSERRNVGRQIIGWGCPPGVLAPGGGGAAAAGNELNTEQAFIPQWT